MLIRAVLFDMDGVLIDSEPGYNKHEAEMMKKLDLPFGEREIAAITGASYKNIPAILERVYNKKLGDPEELTRMYINMLITSIKATVTGLVPGAEEWLKAFRARGIKRAVGSSSPRESVDWALKAFDALKYFDCVITGTEALNGKPAPDIYLMCAEKLNVPIGECMVIEDSVNGIRAGKSAGAYTAAFTAAARHGFDLSAADIEITAFDADNFAKIEGMLI